MAIFKTHTVVHNGQESTAFVPGDTLPGWASGLVGEHCLESSGGPKVEAKKVEPVTEDPVAAEPSDAPDFTKPKPARQQRK